MFKLNDDCHFGNEYLGEYFRNTEQASHTSWSNDPYKDFPAFTSKKPYTKIKNIINKEVEKIFNVDSQMIDEANVSVLQKKLGRMLLPPEDFGKGASIETENPPKTPKPKKKPKQTIRFSGFEDNLMVFNVNLKMKTDDTVRFYASVSANGKYSFNEWHKMGFDIPVEFLMFKICNIVAGKEKIDSNHQIPFENMSPQVLCAKGERLIKYSPSKDSGGNIYGISLNNCSKDEIDFTFDLLLKPLDLTYSIIIDTEWTTKTKAVGDANE